MDQLMALRLAILNSSYFDCPVTINQRIYVYIYTYITLLSLPFYERIL